MMKKIIKELHILVGLPASGKTTFANQYKCNSDYGYRYYKDKYADVIDFDEIYKKAGLKDNGKVNCEKVAKMALRPLYYNILILDGLFVSQEEVEWVLGLYLNSEKFNYSVEKIVVDYWIPDKEACLWNDKGRRNVDSALTIKSIDLPRIDVKKIEQKFGIKTKLELHSVVRKPEYQVFVEENDVQNIKDSKYLESDTWSLGGESWGWDGSKHPVSAETPCNFDAFDELLEKICPTITFLQYKKLYNKCVTMEEKVDSDYYSRVNIGYYRCDLEKLWAMLNEMGISPVVN